MKRISEKQTKDILKNINEEIKTVTKQLEDIVLKLKQNDSKQRWVDWVGQFHKTYAKVDKFNEEEQKQYLSGLVDKIDIKLDAKTNEHLLDIKFQYPIVEDEYVVLKKSDKVSKDRQYEVMGVSRNDTPELHEESKSKGRVHSDRSSVPTKDSD